MEPAAQPVLAHIKRKRRSWLWAVAGLLIAGTLIASLVVFARMRETARARQQYARFVQVGRAIEHYVQQHDNTLPSREVLSQAAGVMPETLLDIATAQPIEYRIVNDAGEQIDYEQFGRRLIAWTPQPSYRGNRLVMLNSLEIYFVPDRGLDLSAQTLLFEDKLNQTSPKLESEVDEGSEVPNTAR